MLCPQNGDRIVTIDSVTSLHTMYTSIGFSTADGHVQQTDTHVNKQTHRQTTEHR